VPELAYTSIFHAMTCFHARLLHHLAIICHVIKSAGNAISYDEPGLTSQVVSFPVKSTIISKVEQTGVLLYHIILFRHIIRIMTPLFSIIALLSHFFFFFLQMSRLLFFSFAQSPKGLLFHLWHFYYFTHFFSTYYCYNCYSHTIICIFPLKVV
jgi:hypothetical protein